MRLIEFSHEADSFAVEPLLGDIDEIREKADKFIDKYLAFYRFFEKHAIFVSKNIESQVKSLHISYFEKALTIYYENIGDSKEAIRALKENYKSIMASNNTIRSGLAQEFRMLLGVES